MPSDCDQLRLFLKGFVEICSRRRNSLDPDIENALRSIISELEDEKVPSEEHFHHFENAFEKLNTRDPHLRYLHCVLTGFRQRKYRSSYFDPGSPAF